MPTRTNFPRNVKRRQQGALERAEQYSKLTLDEKINKQLPFLDESRQVGKQLRKLYALKEKQG